MGEFVEATMQQVKPAHRSYPMPLISSRCPRGVAALCLGVSVALAATSCSLGSSVELTLPGGADVAAEADASAADLPELPDVRSDLQDTDLELDLEEAGPADVPSLDVGLGDLAVDGDDDDLPEEVGPDLPLEPSPSVAGDLLVSLDARDTRAGGVTWPNAGTLGDFTAVGDPFVELLDSVRGVVFDGQTAYEGPATVPALEGASPRTIEAWVYNPAVERIEETVVSWSERGGPTGTFLALNYGASEAFGSASHWSADLGWNGAGPPQPSMWHHLVYTYDGATARVFVDAVLAASRDLILNTKAGCSINLAGQREWGSLVNGVGVPNEAGTLAVALVRIHSGELSAAEVARNYELDRTRFAR